jgi:Tol biopolymer transport system component
MLTIHFLHLFFQILTFDGTQASEIEEKHLKNIKQLTFGGDNAEAYFSPKGDKLCFQTNNIRWGLSCDQIFMYDLHKAGDTTYRPGLISTGHGRTTCAYFMPNGKEILYASTHKGDKACPHVLPPRADKKYIWQIYPDYDIYVSNLKGKITKQLTNTPGYDAEATVSPNGDLIVFTSTRDGDLDLYTMRPDGSDVKRVTTQLGYDGGAFFSPDGKQLVFRASRPKTPEDVKEYIDLLKADQVAPTNMEIYVCNVDGSSLRQVTTLGKANWAPFFHPSGKKIIFSSNHHSSRGYDFQLYLIQLDGTGLEKVTQESIFNAFPMFSPDGKKLVFSSNRNNGGTRDTNLFIADWNE